MNQKILDFLNKLSKDCDESWANEASAEWSFGNADDVFADGKKSRENQIGIQAKELLQQLESKKND